MRTVLDRLISPLVPLSFGAPGLRLRARGFEPLTGMNDRHVVITGANSGIGRAATERLLRLGAHVTMVCRDADRGARARDEIARTAGREPALEQCDVSSLAQVAALAARLRGIDVLMHNAGVLPDRHIETPDGLELTWATHVAGPHLLTRLLAPQMARDGRIVFVSSGGMYLAALGAPGQVAPGTYDGVRAYAITKRAQVVLAELWAEHASDGPLVVSMHPGWADTQAVRTSLPRFHALTRRLLRDPAGGADTLAWLASVPAAELSSGAFYFDRARRSSHIVPWQHDRADLRAALWQWCNDVTEPHVPMRSDAPDRQGELR